MAVEIEIPDDIIRRWEERTDPVVKYPAPVLRQVARPVDHPSPFIRDLVERMKAAMVEASGVGLAAPQMGAPVRLFIYRLPEDNQPWRVILNPRIISAKGEQVGPEGCLSLPYLQGDVKRANEVIVKGLDIMGRPFKRRASEFEARVIQHELDHLDGVLFIDRADPATVHWLSDEEEPDEMLEAVAAR